MPFCDVINCKYQLGKIYKYNGIAYHRFPRPTHKKREEWIQFMRRTSGDQYWLPTEDSRICSMHFGDEHVYFDKYGQCFLEKNAVPVLSDANSDEDEESIENWEEEEEETTVESHQASNINVMLQNASNMEKIPLMDIEVVPSIDQATCDTETVNQQRSVISDIIKSIMHSLDLLIKSDADNVRSADVRNKIIMALFVYNDFVDDKDINMASYKEIDVLDDGNNLKEIDIVYNNNSEDLSITDDDDFCIDSDGSIKDQVNLRKKKADSMKHNIKKIKVKRITPSQKYKSVKIVNESSTIANEDNKMDIVYDNNITSKVDSVADCNTKYERDIDDGIEEFLFDIKKKKENVVKNTKKIKLNEKSSKKQKETAVSQDSEIVNVGEIAVHPIKTVPIPRFVCADCDITVISEHYLTVHKDICKLKFDYYGNPLLDEYWGTLTCPVCDLSFHNLGNLRRHYVAHRVKDVETVFTPLREKELCQEDAERNMILFNNFIAEFEEIEKELRSETSNDSSKKPSITDYVKFNVKKIVYDTVPDKELLCLQCDILFNTKEELEEHKKKINSTDVFICNHCDVTFRQPYKLIAHTKATHKGLYNPHSLYLNSTLDDDVTDCCPRRIDHGLYVCKYCLLIFPQKVSLHAHLTTYKMKGVCRQKSADVPLDKRLPPGIKKNADGELQCNKCETSLPNCRLFMKHYATHLEKKIYCECGKRFRTTANLESHIRVVHYEIQHVVCEVCGATVLYSNMKRHMNVHSDVKPYQCAYCNKRCKAKEALISHIRTHTGEKPWKCKYCGMAFSERRTYNIHINIHEGRTPYKCTQCPSAFVSKLKLNKHSLEHNNCRKNK